MTGPAILSRAGLDELIAALIADGYRVIGPVAGDSAIELAEISSGAQLPAGWGADSGPGWYRLRRRGDQAVFGHSAGSQSWKQFLHPPRQRLWTADASGFTPAQEAQEEPVRLAFLGVRACDLAAIATLGRVLGGGAHRDSGFTRRRAGLFVIAAGCTEPGGVCFCASMGTGPEPGPGYDLSLTERIDGDGHRFLVDVGTEEGSRESPRWAEVAGRCLTCGNCTMVCPTCFCTTTEDSTSLAADGAAERSQRWASCFERDFSYLHGGSVRTSGASRYRQWITHKLSSWHDQFGGSGCVGCGRCIAWCPAAIDITEEAARLAQDRDAQEDRDDQR